MLFILTILWLCFLCTDGASEGGLNRSPNLRNKGTYSVQFSEHEYILHFDALTWEEANLACQQDDSYFAILEDAIELKGVADMLQEDESKWIGARFHTRGNDWIWESTGYDVTGNYLGYPPMGETDSDCLAFNRNSSGNSRLYGKECNEKLGFLCERGCPILNEGSFGIWEPKNCTSTLKNVGDVCGLTCKNELELVGSNPQTCTKFGWNNTVGINIIPSCKEPSEIANALVDELEDIFEGREVLLAFIIDEAVDDSTFKTQIHFIVKFMHSFPLSPSRVASLIGNSKNARIIYDGGPMDTCDFLNLVKGIKQGEPLPGNLSEALLLAQESLQAKRQGFPVICILSGSAPLPDDNIATSQLIKRKGTTIIGVGLGNFDREAMLQMVTILLTGPPFHGIANRNHFDAFINQLEAHGNHHSCQLDEPLELVSSLKTALTSDASILFILDEAATWGQEQFQMGLTIMQRIVESFPLSKTRRGGLIAAAKKPFVIIPMRNADTCSFMRQTSKVRYEPSISNMKTTLKMASLEASKNNPNGKTVIVIISPNSALRNSSTNICSSECKTIQVLIDTSQGDGNELVGDEDSDDEDPSLVFHVDTNSKLEGIVQALLKSRPTPTMNCSDLCPRLETDARGSWKGPNCTTDVGRAGKKCTLVCQEEYEVFGCNPLICGPGGWTGSSGIGVLPKCTRPEEMADLLVHKIHAVVDHTENANFLFVLDESGSIGLTDFKIELDFVASIVDSFPLSNSRFAGVMLFSDRVRVIIPLNTNDTCRLLRITRRIQYNGGGTDVRKALILVRKEIQKRAVHPQTIVFLVTDGISQEDPLQAALNLQSDGVTIFVIGVADYRQEQLEPLASVGPDGTSNFFGVKSYKVFNRMSQYLNETFSVVGLNCKKSKTS